MGIGKSFGEGAMASTNTIIGSLIRIYNDSSKLPDPISGRVGSFFFGPNQEIVFTRYMPKGKVEGGITFSDDKSFGRAPKRAKHYNIHVSFFTSEGIVDRNTGYKNEELVNDYLDRIEQVTLTNTGSVGQVVLESMQVEEDPWYVQENGTYRGRYLFVFKDRR